MNKHTILIVDDQKINLEILSHLLEDDYEVIKAEDGKTALDLMRERADDISAIILDIVMPNMNGYEVLEEMNKNPKLAIIPVIVSSQETDIDTEMKALTLGAQDFIGKPYKGALIRQRLANTIKLRETAAIVNKAERDELTGLYNKQFFVEKVRERLDSEPDGKFSIISFGIERFKLINEAFGVKQGDEMLKFIADLIKESLSDNCIFGRFNGDWFYILIPFVRDFDGQIFKEYNDKINEFGIEMIIKTHCGIYKIVDNKDSVEHMCDLAKLASIKNHGKYDTYFTYYDDSMREDIVLEQFITNSMSSAIENKEFQVYYQPKYNIYSESIVGAEALVRWNHPKKGFLSPGVFIPVFERNGFITQLDKYVWEKVCMDIREWMDKGIPFVPVSVNVSRTDIFNPNLLQIIVGLLEKYEIPIELLHLEITESAYTDNPEQIIETVGQLHDRGFTIEMDDFGSGYSSLNMLSELPVDIIKMDMGFVQQESKSTSGKGIMSFVISLAKWMKLAVIAEGVEVEEQIEALKSMDCSLVQGYYYSKPLPKEQYEEKISCEVDKNQNSQEEKKVKIKSQYKENEKEHVMLIVDDIEINRDVLSSFFYEKYEIVEKSNGEEALAYLKNNYEKVEVVLLDLIMPVVDGFQTLKHMKEDVNLKNIPVIVTSQGDEKAEETALELGADDFISKPYNGKIIEKRVENLVQISDLKKKLG